MSFSVKSTNKYIGHAVGNKTPIIRKKKRKNKNTLEDDTLNQKPLSTSSINGGGMSIKTSPLGMQDSF